MKKLVSLALAVLRVCSLSIGVGAEDGLRDEDSEVYLTVEEMDAAATVYSIDIAWNGDLSFVYDKGQQGAWNEDTHSYGDTLNAGWSTSTHNVTITNHSNAAIQYDAAYSKTDENIQNGVTFTFKEPVEDEEKTALADVQIAMPEIGGDAESSTFTVKANGTPTTTHVKTEIGRVTVTIQAVGAP